MHKDGLRLNKIAYYMRKRGHIAVNLLNDIPWQASNPARHVKICWPPPPKKGLNIFDTSSHIGVQNILFPPWLLVLQPIINEWSLPKTKYHLGNIFWWNKVHDIVSVSIEYHDQYSVWFILKTLLGVSSLRGCIIFFHSLEVILCH